MTFVLVPGAGGVAAYWNPVIDELRRRGHEAVAVDLPGDDESAGLPEYVAAVVAVCAGSPDVVLVGQSLGGFSAAAACAQVSPSMLILVNAMIPRPGETAGEWWGATGSSEARRAKDVRDGRGPDAEFDLATYFFHDVPPESVAELSAQGRDEVDAVFASASMLTAWPDVVTHVVVGRDDRLFPVEFQQRVARDRLGLEADVIPGGHLVALSQPVELVDRLVGYLGE